MNVEEALKINSRLTDSNHLQARAAGYLECLSGPEVFGLAEAAKGMIDWIERNKHPHLIDTDENPGQALREALKTFRSQTGEKA